MNTWSRRIAQETSWKHCLEWISLYFRASLVSQGASKLPIVQGFFVYFSKYMQFNSCLKKIFSYQAWFEWTCLKKFADARVEEAGRGTVCWNRVLRRHFLKYGSEEKGYSLCKCSILLGFIMSKKYKRLRSELLLEDKITNLLGFLT